MITKQDNGFNIHCPAFSTTLYFQGRFVHAHRLFSRSLSRTPSPADVSSIRRPSFQFQHRIVVHVSLLPFHHPSYRSSSRIPGRTSRVHPVRHVLPFSTPVQVRVYY